VKYENRLEGRAKCFVHSVAYCSILKNAGSNEAREYPEDSVGILKYCRGPEY
jgi:hypothetical protein